MRAAEVIDQVGRGPRGERAVFWAAAFLGALFIHVLVALGLSSYTRYKLRHPDPVLQNVPIEVAVVERPRPPPPQPAKEKEARPPPKPVPMKVARLRKVKPIDQLPPPVREPPPPASDAPPPPTIESKAPSREPIRAIAGILESSTVVAGDMAAGVGNTLRGTPGRAAPAPAEVKPYKAERYASSAQVTELPSVLNRESVDLRKFYPPAALKSGFEGDVQLRLIIDSDGSIAKTTVTSDPGQGLADAALRAIREYRFSPGKVNGAAVATTVPFTIRFVIN